MTVVKAIVHNLLLD